MRRIIQNMRRIFYYLRIMCYIIHISWLNMNIDMKCQYYYIFNVNNDISCHYCEITREKVSHCDTLVSQCYHCKLHVECVNFGHIPWIYIRNVIIYTSCVNNMTMRCIFHISHYKCVNIRICIAYSILFTNIVFNYTILTFINIMYIEMLIFSISWHIMCKCERIYIKCIQLCAFV